MADPLKLHLFGDQTFDVYAHLQDLIRQRHHPVLQDFLNKVYDVLRIEISKLPSALRDDLPRFTCLDDVLSRKPGEKPCIPLDMAVTCMYQLGTFISHTDARTYCGADACILGLCTGSLAAAAVSCSRSTLELVPLGIHAVTLAFRTGLRVVDIAERIEPMNDTNQSWSIVVSGAAAGTSAVSGFCQETAMPNTRKPFVSATLPSGITVSGPPSSLAQLLASEHCKDLRYQSLPIYGPYHAPHLFSEEDVDELVESLAIARLETTSFAIASNPIPLLSSNGAQAAGDGFEARLKYALGQILLQPIEWKAIIDEIQNCLQNSGAKSFCVTSVGTKAEQLIYTSLKQTSFRDLLPKTPTPNRSLHSEDGASPKSRQPKLAIIGMSGRFPGADDNEAFWDLLYQGLDVHKPVPPLRWDADTHVDPTGERKNTGQTPFGCWLDDAAAFDARFFNISPREAPQIDPAQRIALMTAYEALEQAGIVPDATPSTRRDRVGVFYGVTSNDWMETNSAQNIDTYFIPGGNRAFVPGRINYYFKFSGPSYAVDTACSSSLAGIHLACNSLWQGDIDTAIAGGTNVLTNPDFTAGLDRGHFLSRTGNCKTFDDSADGYCRGEGVGTLIIKRLDDAIADNDPVLGVILSAYTNHSAESESITRPHVGAQRDIFRKILNQSVVDPYDVSYVEMHGTGTQAGDAGEMSSVLDTFAPPPDQVEKLRSDDEALYLGSAKANIGHGEAASGVSSMIKVLLMLQKNIIVPHCGIKTRINHRFPTDLEERNVNIADKPIQWEPTDPLKPRRVFVNNFSAAGGNSAVLLEDAPPKREYLGEDTDQRTSHLVAVSAKNGPSLQGNLRSMLDYLKESPDISLGKLSYTTTARRMHHRHRVLLTGSSTEQLCTQIETALRDETGVVRPKSAPKVIFTFTGQGAQYPGMGKDLFQNFSVFRTEVLRLDRIGRSLGFPSVLPVIQSDEQDIGHFTPIVVQLASVCIQIALSKLWASWNITPLAVVGHSLGEYAALCVAGVLSEADTIYLVGKRAELLQENCTRDSHAMLVVKASVDEIAKVLEGKEYEVACINSPVETVLAGPKEQISGLQSDIGGLKTTLLKVPYAFHSSQVDPILESFKKLAHGVTFSAPKVPVLSPLDGHVVDCEGEFNPEYLARHSREPVNMQKALEVAYSAKVVVDQATTLEIGTHPAISGMVRAIFGSQIKTIASLQRGRPVFQVLTEALKTLYVGGADIQWAMYHCDFQASHEVLPLPAYSWDLRDYWMQYVHNWSLHKGEPQQVISDGLNLATTTIHRVVEETGDSNKTSIIVEADIARDDLSPLVQGHEVDGVPLCTPSVYADIALSLGQYLLSRYRPDQKEDIIDVGDMTISKALILRSGAKEQLLQAHAEINWVENSSIVKFLSFDNRQKLQEHSRCVLRFNNRGIQDTIQEQADATEVQQKIQSLRNGLVTGESNRFNRPMVYRAIRPLARFHEDYRAIDEILLNSNTLEASSHLSFGSVKKGGTFHTHPAIIDALTQVCGFTMNCNDYTDLDMEVFMNHGWSSFQIFESIDFEKKYTTYTKMTEGEGKLWQGNVTILDGEKVVAYFGGLAIQGVPRRILKAILSREAGGASQPQKQQQRVTKADALTTDKPSNSLTSTESQDRKVSQAMSIIAEESGLAQTDLTDNTSFTDVGIDSLLGLTISARFKEEIDVDLDFSALFLEFPTVGELKASLGGPESHASSTNSNSSGASSETGISTPEDREFSGAKVDFQQALEIITSESGVATADLTDETDFAESGVDSLLSLVIASRLRDELGLEIQHETFFLECPTVGDLKKLVGEDTPPQDEKSSNPQHGPDSTPTSATANVGAKTESKPARKLDEDINQLARKQAIDGYVQRYGSGFSISVPKGSSAVISDAAKTVLVTGASGSLGSHLVDQIAKMDNVQKVICLNREKNTDPYTRQQKAMRDKGIRSFDQIRSKLLVIQTDSTKPKLGLTSEEYDGLTSSVTHLIHNAWPMSAKRDLDGFEPQFITLRNLIDFARDAVARRSADFKFSFQMISSIGVVGHYGLDSGETHTIVPEDRVDISSLLPNGYSAAKWGCERILDETLQKYSNHFRTMIVRLGQIAGSKTSGYWNPMEHFGFLVKSSQTLGALPDVGGKVYWTPVNDVAGACADLVLGEHTPYPIYHVENPVGQPWSDMNAILADALKIPKLVPFESWVEMVRAAPPRNNPASTLLDFLDSNYLRMSCGGLVLDTQKALEHSKTLRSVGPVSEETARKYVHIWKEIGFLE